MYKRKRRRNHRGKKKSTSPAPKPAVSSDELKVAGATGTCNNIMSVTTIEVAENHHHQQQQQPQRQPEELTTSNSKSKAVGARKRKPMQISKIVDKRPMMDDPALDFGAEKNLVHNNNNNNNMPPFKKLCLESNKNGMIKSIVSELKTNKLVVNRGDALVTRRYERDEDEDDEDDTREEEIGVRIKDEQDDEDENENEEGADYSGNEEANYLNKKHNLDFNTAFKDRYGAGNSLKDHRECLSTDRLAVAKNIISINGIPGIPDSKHGCVLQCLDDGDEGADLRSVTGNSTGDDELPFRCGVCAYGSCDKSTLLRHMRTHSGERPFQCRLCFFAFTTKANCERHLRNRHGQNDRDQLRTLVVCLPMSSNTSESETEVNPNGGAGHPENLVTSVKPKRKRTSGGSVTAEETELPLDLSMDAVDLSTKSRDGNHVFRRVASLPRPRAMYAASEIHSSIVTSPFATKREPLVHPLLPLSGFSPPISQPSPLVGVPHSNYLFPFGAPPGFNPFSIPPANENFIALRTSSPSNSINAYATSSPRTSFESRETLSTTEKEVKVKPVSLKRKSHPKSTSSSSASPTNSGSNKKRCVNPTGEYQKPKQRRYRTERPFACPHCPARFTLRSNMERHGKHQHPTIWQRSPSNRVINRQKNQQLSPLVGSPTLVPQTNNAVSDSVESSRVPHEQTLAALQQHVKLKGKVSNSSPLNNNNGSETETDPENTPAHASNTLGGDTPDLSSVYQMLNRVKSSNFTQYFNGTGHNSSNDHMISEDDIEGDESGDVEEDVTSEEGDSKTSGGEKKKSAYSSAPHKISCPHCTRRFPWTSSLRRHLLTHTGQKPFQCSKCPLLFTTKSNCDRHLARKHSGANSKGASDSNNSSEDEDGEVEEEKEEESVTCDEEAGVETYGNGNNTCGLNNPNNLVKTPLNGSTSSSPGEDAAFRCHLCEAAAGEREALLAHMEENHKDTFHLLVSKGALSSSPPSENSETEQIPPDQRDVTHRKVMCVFCIRRFWSVEDLRRHIRSHSGERPFSCPHCSRRFTLKHSMLRHLKKHSNSVTPSRKVTKIPKDLSIVPTPISTPGNVLTAAGSHHKNGDLIGRLLGLNDDQLVEKLLSQPDAKDAAKLLGLGQQQQLQQSSSRVTSKVT